MVLSLEPDPDWDSTQSVLATELACQIPEFADDQITEIVAVVLESNQRFPSGGPSLVPLFHGNGWGILNLKVDT